jgi:hypothetical protein
MKRYLIFAGSNYYPSGGWDDFRGSTDTLDEATSIAKGGRHDWWHVVDTHTETEVASDADDTL